MVENVIKSNQEVFMRLTILIIFLCIASIFADTIPLGVKNVATSLAMLSTLADGTKKDQGLGVSKNAKLSDIKIGTPIQPYIIDNKLLQSAVNLNSMRSLIKPGNGWYIPIIENDIIVSFLSVAYYKPDSVVTVGGGSSAFAKSWDVILKVWPKSSGYNPILVEIGMNGFFFIPEKGDSNLTRIKPIDDGKENALYYKDAFAYYAKLTSSNEVLSKLRQ